MGDDGSRTQVDNLRKEFALFWQSILGENGPVAEIKSNDELLEKLDGLDPHKLKTITKSLSDARKHLHQKLERINKEIDLNSAKSESLRLVGGETSETLNRINELNEIGQEISHELFELDEQLKIIRNWEDSSTN